MQKLIKKELTIISNFKIYLILFKWFSSQEYKVKTRINLMKINLKVLDKIKYILDYVNLFDYFFWYIIINDFKIWELGLSSCLIIMLYMC